MSIKYNNNLPVQMNDSDEENSDYYDVFDDKNNISRGRKYTEEEKYNSNEKGISKFQMNGFLEVFRNLLKKSSINLNTLNNDFKKIAYYFICTLNLINNI